jgi:hypothetical protein
LGQLWLSDDLHHLSVSKNPHTDQWTHTPAGSIEEAAARAIRQSKGGLDAYMACAEFGSPGKRKAENAVGACAFWLDVDCGPSKAEAGNGYADATQALAATLAFVAHVGIPDPTHVVNSGAGLHFYWALDAFLPREFWQASARKLKALAKACDLLADPTRTADIASILRVPGTLNYKYTPPRPVQLVMAADAPIVQAAMLAGIDAAHERLCPRLVAARPTRQQAANASHVLRTVDESYGPPDLTKLASALETLDPDCEESIWSLYRIAPMAREARLYPELEPRLRALATRWSSGELRGVPSQKWRTPGGNGLSGEEAFGKAWKRFLRAPYAGDRPVTLGSIYHDAKMAQARRDVSGSTNSVQTRTDTSSRPIA